MSRPPGEPSELSRVDFLPTGSDGSWSPVAVADKIWASSRSYRKDHCAVVAEPDSQDLFLRDSGLDVDLLDPRDNLHWTGASHRRKLKRFLVGDYDDWFQWFMRWQRFNAFQIIVLVKPIGYLADSETRGYIDGFLVRLLPRPCVHSVIIVEDERFRSLATGLLDGRVDFGSELKSKFRRRQIEQAASSVLYGTNLSRRAFSQAIARTLYSRVNRDWESTLNDIMRRPSIVKRAARSIFTAGSYAQEMVESMATDEVFKSLEHLGQSLPAKFHRANDRGPSELSRDWIEGLARTLLKSEGCFTLPGLYEFVNSETQKVIQTSETFPDIFNDHYNFDYPGEKHVFLPSRAELRRMVEKLAAERKLAKATWSKEVGRPSTVYYESGRLPFIEESRCGQCAFYVSLRRQCRIWWLLNHSYGHLNPRWTKDGEHPLTTFDLYKMRNSWRIGPHASACTRFLDKKRDYSLKALPELCDVCGEQLKGPPKSPMVICGNCRTRYYLRRDGKRTVLTSYEHEFRTRYQDLAGVDPSSDLKRLIEERQGSTPAVVEQAIFEHRRLSSIEDADSAPKTIMLFEGDNMLVRNGVMYVFKRRTIESLPLAGSTLVDQGHVVNEEQKAELETAGMMVRSVQKPVAASPGAARTPRYDIAPMVEKIVAEHPEFVRRMAMAMAESAIHATLRIGEVAVAREEEIRSSVRRQRTWMRRLESVPPNRFLVCEAAIMREYWNCYYSPIKGAYQRSGPRKKARFVREFVTDPAGRARGYTAVDAAINYLHQRRLSKARWTNIELGLSSNPGEGFLHRKRWNAEGLGLVLDLIDPFKFADREKLLGAIIDVSLNWRDFYGATDRHGARFYYPKPEAVGVLEGVGEAADTLTVTYGGAEFTVAEAYRRVSLALIRKILDGTSSSFEPFIF